MPTGIYTVVSALVASNCTGSLKPLEINLTDQTYGTKSSENHPLHGHNTIIVANGDLEITGIKQLILFARLLIGT